MFGLCESFGPFLGLGVVSGNVCNLFAGVSSLKIGHVNEHGQPPWTKIVWHFMFGHIGAVSGGGLCQEMFVINSRGVFLEDRSRQ